MAVLTARSRADLWIVRRSAVRPSRRRRAKSERRARPHREGHEAFLARNIGTVTRQPPQVILGRWAGAFRQQQCVLRAGAATSRVIFIIGFPAHFVCFQFTICPDSNSRTPEAEPASKIDKRSRHTRHTRTSENQSRTRLIDGFIQTADLLSARFPGRQQQSRDQQQQQK